MFAKVAPGLFELGYPVLPAHGKAVTLLDWQNLAITEEQVSHWAKNGQAQSNVGIRCGDDSVCGVAVGLADFDIYDLDVCRRVRASFIEHMGAAGVLRVGQAPKTGMVYRVVGGLPKLTSPVWVSANGRKHKFELLMSGQQFVGYGTHPDTKKEYRWPEGGLEDREPWELPLLDRDRVDAWMRDVLPGLLPGDWVIEVGSGSSLPRSSDPLDSIVPRLDIEDSVIDLAMKVLDPDMDHDSWVRVGMGLQHQLGEEGFPVWAEWSRRGSKFNGEGELRAKWRSFEEDAKGGGRRPVTFASALKMARESEGWDEAVKAEKVEALTGWIERIQGCADAHDVEHLAREEISADKGLTTIDRAQIERALVSRLAELGVVVPIKDVRGMLKPRARQRSTGGNGMEDWCADYVWCNQTDSFIRISTQQTVTMQSFNATHGRDVKGKWVTPEGFQMSAAQVALQELQIPTVVRRMYLPWADTFFEYDGMSHLNLYRPSSVPESKVITDWNDGDREAVERLSSHVLTLLGPVNSAVVLDWMAYCVQKPGDKIKWSILIKGMPGDGKSFLGDVMRAVMGVANVGTVNPKVLNTDFNGWAEGHCVCLLEEIRMAGHNRHDVMNSLKELHTNDIITIHAKKMNSYSACNTQNYLGFTNYADALPLDDQDRRWFIAFSQFHSKEELEAAGLTAAYFVSLFALLTEHVGALREWLLQRDVSAFNAKGRAPESDAKLAMIANTTNEDDSMIREIIEEGIIGVSKDVVSTNLLTTHITLNNSEIEVPKGRALAAVMMRLGFNKVRKPIKWKGATQRVWVRQLSVAENMEKVSELLDATDVPPSDCPF